MRWILTIPAVLALAACAAPEPEIPYKERVFSHLPGCGWPTHPDGSLETTTFRISQAEADAIMRCAMAEERLAYALTHGGITGTDNPVVLESYYNWPPSRLVTIFCNGC
jgi:hypothetical protein